MALFADLLLEINTLIPATQLGSLTFRAVRNYFMKYGFLNVFYAVIV